MTGRTRMGFVSRLPAQSSCIGPNALAEEVRSRSQRSRWNVPCAIGVAGMILMAGVMMR